MAVLDIDWKPDATKLRSFGWIAGVLFPLLGALVGWRGGLFGLSFGAAAGGVALALAALGALAALLAFVRPEANRPLYLVLVTVTAPIGLVLSYLIMGTIFFGLITPLGLVFRLARRDPLRLRPPRGAASYWVARPRRPVPAERYFKQF